MILDTYDDWAQAQIAAIIEYFGLEKDDERSNRQRPDTGERLRSY